MRFYTGYITTLMNEKKTFLLVNHKCQASGMVCSISFNWFNFLEEKVIPGTLLKGLEKISKFNISGFCIGLILKKSRKKYREQVFIP